MHNPPHPGEVLTDTVLRADGGLTVTELAKMESLRSANRRPTHPGAILREDVLPALQMSQTELADRLGVSRQIGVGASSLPVVCNTIHT